MSAQGRGYKYSYREVLTILGNGNAANGRTMLDEFAQRLVHARTEHPADEWKDAGDGYALMAMEDELREVLVAMKLESSERVRSEVKDLLATGWRTYGDEHK